jgi:hypothetical protein
MDRPTVVDALTRLQELADYVVPLTLRAVCDLRVADLLVDGPRPVGELAAETGAHEGALYRALRALATVGVFSETAPGRFGLTPLADLLRGDHPLSVRDAYPLLAADLYAWAHLDHTLRTGEAAFPHAHGRTYYAHLADHPDESARFDRSVQAQNRLVLRTLFRAYEWRRCGTLVDVGGGNGAFLAGLLSRYRTLRGVLFDLPHVLRGAPAVLRAAGVAERCDLVAGSFFESVPAGGDTYLLRTILHDWDDERATAILRAVRARLGRAGRLLVLEALLPPGDETHIGKLLDLHSLVLVAGPDRTRTDYERLLARAGLGIERVTATPTLAIMQARPTAS